jgi:SOS-response transcriptional repressor LexA
MTYRLGHLTERQREILNAVKVAYAALGEPPSVRSLARRFEMDHRAVQEHLEALYRKGWLETPSPAGLRCLHVESDGVTPTQS